MESEKVKEIKKALASSFCSYFDYVDNIDGESIMKRLWIRSVINLINELESENERLVESCKNCHYIKDLEIANGHAKELKDRIAELENIGLNEEITVGEYLREMQRLKDRVADLEKENAIKTDTIVDLLKKQEFYEKEKLTKFAERLKEKLKECSPFVGFDLEDLELDGETIQGCIDETLKEFIND